MREIQDTVLSASSPAFTGLLHSGKQTWKTAQEASPQFSKWFTVNVFLCERRALNCSPAEKRQERERLGEGGEGQEFYPGSASHGQGSVAAVTPQGWPSQMSQFMCHELESSKMLPRKRLMLMKPPAQGMQVCGGVCTSLAQEGYLQGV